MVGAKNIYHQIKAALGLVPMVGDVGHPVGRFTEGFDEDAVFVVAKFGGFEPVGTVFGIDIPFFLQRFESFPHFAGFVETLLAVVDIKDDVDAAQRFFLRLGNAFFGIVAEEFGGLLLQGIAMLRQEVAGNVNDLVAFVVVCFQGNVLPQKLEIADLG